jgi:hypothetical protein
MCGVSIAHNFQTENNKVKLCMLKLFSNLQY